jgi:hypothetical protein
MFNVELSVGDFGCHAVVALRGEFDLADVPAVESHLIAVVAACGPLVPASSRCISAWHTPRAARGRPGAGPAAAPGQPMPPRLPVLASAGSWYAARAPGNAAADLGRFSNN